MSPEQASGDRPLDGRSDIYALGCVLYEMLAGEPPFTGPTAQAIMARHAMDPVPSLRTVRLEIGAGLSRVVRRALAKVPSDRYPTAADFADALAAPDADSTGEAEAHVADEMRRPIRKVLGIAAALAIPALGIFLETTSRRKADDALAVDPAVIAITPFACA